jgi:hypothetical protein
MIQEISDWFVGDDSTGTALANLVTIGGVFGGLAILGKISASLSLSGDISVRLLHASLKAADDSSATLNENWPPGDRSRILYSVYSVSRKWDEPYWSGNLAHNDARLATAAQRAAYGRHVAESVALFDGVLVHAPGEGAREKWEREIAPHLDAHRRFLRRWRWRALEFRYSKEMRRLLKRARR